MLPDQHLTAKNLEIKDDTRAFLDATLLNLVRLLHQQELNSKDCNFLGNNDIFLIRFQEVIATIFSRGTRAYRVTITEEDRREPEEAREETVADDQQNSQTPVAPIFAPRRNEDLSQKERNYLSTVLHAIDPVVVEFPYSYLSLQGEEMEEASMRVAELLIEPTKEDVDRKNRIVRVLPIFSGRDFLIDPELVFVLMDFAEPYTDIYRTLIKPTVEAEGFRCVRSDDIFRTSAVIEDIWENINKAALVIAEISNTNPNVMYELGICHTIGKEVMMLTQDGTSVPFNFRHLRFYQYSNNIPGSEDLKRNIQSILQEIRNRLPIPEEPSRKSE
jgi:hypothetical protein